MNMVMVIISIKSRQGTDRSQNTGHRESGCRRAGATRVRVTRQAAAVITVMSGMRASCGGRDIYDALRRRGQHVGLCDCVFVACMCWPSAVRSTRSTRLAGRAGTASGPAARPATRPAVGALLICAGLAPLEYTAVAWCVGAAAVRFYEEPILTRKFGAEYAEYRRAVRAWIPRLHPWTPGQSAGPAAQTRRHG
jgi:hypothetical protein